MIDLESGEYLASERKKAGPARNRLFEFQGS
jgi:hypothetical protein